ncbi:ABC transporter ATP-binding protein [Paenibacillus rhizovicinus]|uniref:ABC transporter ATP-binding protein n=1 Tax=Paenibacillus rhizovicinus TaxID=2704463 RepID=A0A6C0NV42_9BACL|nr:ABC transporter ATP-binding protein [Paenibacillus rhizovicinus]QHW29796.1 ABC transporter ATP-binding protein [Paenibacillus rhizovicinus]
MSAFVYDVQQVSQSYKKGKTRILANEHITMNIREGEIVGVLGPNGAGKSTLIKQLVGHLKPTEGRVLFCGQDVHKQTHTVAGLVAYFAQEPHVLSSLRVIDALVYTGQLRGMSAWEAKRQALELLERFEMSDLGDKLMKRLSGGQKRMIGIGTTLIGRSPVLIFDEPTNELDPKKRRLVWSLIQERNREGATVILVTHNVLEAEQVVDRVAVINHGRLLALDHVSRLKQRVDQRLKFELTAAYGKREEAESVLQLWGEVQAMSENRLRLLVEKEQAHRLFDFIMENPALPIEDYTITPPSLEDVYFHIDAVAASSAVQGQEAIE